MTFCHFSRWLFYAVFSLLPCAAQEGESITLRFLSFPLTVNPAPLELLVGEGKTIKIETPSNEVSGPYKVKLQTTWAVGQTVEDKDGKAIFNVLGKATALTATQQLLILVRKGKDLADGFEVIPIDYRGTAFGGGKFLFMNAAKVDIGGVIGTEKFAVKPGQHTIIKPKSDSDPKGLCHTTFYFRNDDQPKPFFSSTWPLSDDACALIFFYHDPATNRLRLHSIRDYPAAETR